MYIAMIDPAVDTEEETYPKDIATAFELLYGTGSTDGYDADYKISHIYIQYLYLFTSGEHKDAKDSAAGQDGQPWLEWSVIN